MMTLLRLFLPSLADLGSIGEGHLQDVLARDEMDAPRIPEPRRAPAEQSTRLERPHLWKESA